jgi:exo-1,4-beta-D-glucosaminidase
VSWQIYDWYLRPHAGYYFIKRACEPLHIQLDPSDGSAWVVNATREDRRNLEARIRIYDPAFKLTRESSATIDVPAGSVREVPDASAREVARSALDGPSAGLLPPGGAGYAALRLYDKGKLVSDNFYWLSPDGRFGFLASLPPAGLEVSAKRGLIEGRSGVRVRLRNGGKAPAFFIHLRIIRGGKEILPSFWSDNFSTLLPGESRDVTWRSIEETLTQEPLRVEVEGWNVPAQAVAVR